MKRGIERGILLLLIGASLWSLYLAYCNCQLIKRVQVLSGENTRLIGRLCELYSGEEEK